MRYSKGLSSLSHCSSSFFVLITIVHFDLTKIYSRGELKRPVWSGIARLSYDRIPDEGTHPSLQNNGILHWNSGDPETSWCFFFLQLVLSQKHSLNPQKPHISKPSTRGIHNLFFSFWLFQLFPSIRKRCNLQRRALFTKLLSSKSSHTCCHIPSQCETLTFQVKGHDQRVRLWCCQVHQRRSCPDCIRHGYKIWKQLWSFQMSWCWEDICHGRSSNLGFEDCSKILIALA